MKVYFLMLCFVHIVGYALESLVFLSYKFHTHTMTRWRERERERESIIPPPPAQDGVWCDVVRGTHTTVM